MLCRLVMGTVAAQGLKVDTTWRVRGELWGFFEAPHIIERAASIPAATAGVAPRVGTGVQIAALGRHWVEGVIGRVQ